MKIHMNQSVKIEGDTFPHFWSKEYDSLVVPRKGGYIEDPLWKDPGEYEVEAITINYYNDSCYVSVKPYSDMIGKTQAGQYNKIAELHGWKAS